MLNAGAEIPAGEVYFALTPEGFETLLRNSAELTRWSREARWQIDYYRASEKKP